MSEHSNDVFLLREILFLSDFVLDSTSNVVQWRFGKQTKNRLGCFLKRFNLNVEYDLVQMYIL